MSYALPENYRISEAKSVHPKGGAFVVLDADRTSLVIPFDQVLYMQCVDKSVKVCTSERAHWLSGHASLSKIEAANPGRWLRIHANAMVAPTAIERLSIVRLDTGENGYIVHLTGLPNPLSVSRRRWRHVKRAVGKTTRF